MEDVLNAHSLETRFGPFQPREARRGFRFSRTRCKRASPWRERAPHWRGRRLHEFEENQHGLSNKLLSFARRGVLSPGRALLALNAGSSSLKFALYNVGVALNLTAHGEVENLDSKPHFIACDSKGGVLAETRAATADFAAPLDGLL